MYKCGHLSMFSMVGVKQVICSLKSIIAGHTDVCTNVLGYAEIVKEKEMILLHSISSHAALGNIPLNTPNLFIWGPV